MTGLWCVRIEEAPDSQMFLAFATRVSQPSTLSRLRSKHKARADNRSSSTAKRQRRLRDSRSEGRQRRQRHGRHPFAGDSSPRRHLTGWNLRPRGLAEDELSGLLGSYISVPKTRLQRKQSGDPRRSSEERQKDRADYVRQVSRAARSLVEQRYLLPEDAERIIEEASKYRLR